MCLTSLWSFPCSVEFPQRTEESTFNLCRSLVLRFSKKVCYPGILRGKSDNVLHFVTRPKTWFCTFHTSLFTDVVCIKRLKGYMALFPSREITASSPTATRTITSCVSNPFTNKNNYGHVPTILKDAVVFHDPHHTQPSARLF